MPLEDSQTAIQAAVAFLHSVDDIEDFPSKVSERGYLRHSCLNHLRRLYDLTQEQAETALTIYLGRGHDEETLS
jgi:hypothetical protein